MRSGRKEATFDLSASNFSARINQDILYSLFTRCFGEDDEMSPFPRPLSVQEEPISILEPSPQYSLCRTQEVSVGLLLILSQKSDGRPEKFQNPQGLFGLEFALMGSLEIGKGEAKRGEAKGGDYIL